MIIRQFRSTDSVPQMTELLHAAYMRLLNLGMKYVATSQETAVTLDRINKGTCFVADDGGFLVGTIVFEDQRQTAGCPWYDRDDVASFHQFAVDPSRQGEGIGLALVKTAEDAARLAGAKHLAIDTSEWAYHLIDWYTSLGYRIVEETQWKDVNYRSVIMSKDLHAAPQDFSRTKLGQTPEFLRNDPSDEHRDEANKLEHLIKSGDAIPCPHETFGRLGELYRILREPKKALRYLELAAVAAVAAGDQRALLIQRCRMGIAYNYAGKHATANHILARLVTAFDGDKERLGFVHQHYGKCLVEQDRQGEAMTQLLKAAECRAESGVSEGLRASTAEAIAALVNLRNRTAYNRMASIYAGDAPVEDDAAWRQACRDAFSKRLKGKKVLEVGCGPGTDAKFFSDQGLDVLATDFCEPFLAIVRERYPAMKTAWLDVTCAFDVGRFNGIYGHSCFLHISRAMAAPTLEHLRSALTPGGTLFLSLVKSTKVKEYSIQSWGGIEGNASTFFCYEPNEMVRLFGDAGFTEIEVLDITWSDDSAYSKGEVKARMDEQGLSPYQVAGRFMPSS